MSLLVPGKTCTQVTPQQLLMRLKLLCTMLFFMVASVRAGVLSQTVTLHEKNVPLEKILRSIEAQTGYGFNFNRSLLVNLPKLSVNVKDKSINEALSICLEGLPVSFVVNNNEILLRKKEEAVLRELALLPPKNIKGKIVDSLGNALAGIYVSVKGTKIVTSTDDDGSFELSAVAEDAVLIINGVAIEKQEISLSGRTRISITARIKVTQLNEVAIQVNTGYQRIRPEQSTGSVSIMSHKEYDSRINTTDFLAGLQSRIPGLMINNDIEFEGNSLFQIRGISTINGSKQPLIVIDGFPTELSLATINPNEIESVTVLRDAAAATIYGVRASNGVIVIERKKAKLGKPNIAYRTTFSITPKENYDRYRWDKDGSNTTIEYIKESNANIGATAWMLMTNLSAGSIFTYPPPYVVLAKKAAGLITAEEANSQLEALKLHNNTNEYGRLFLQNATTQTHNLDISGGNENATYFITAQFNQSDLSKVKNGNSRFGLNARTNLRMSKRLSLELTTNFQESREKAVPVIGISSLYPYERLQDDNGNALPVFSGSNMMPELNDMLMANGLLDNLHYPLNELNLVSNKTNTITNRFTVNFRYDIGNGLNANIGGVYETSRAEKRHLANENAVEVRQYVNYYTQTGTTGLVYNIPKGDFLQQTHSSTESYTARAQLNYNKQITSDHSLNLIAGTEIRRVVSKGGTSSYFGYSDQTLLQRAVNYSVIQTSFVSAYHKNNAPLSYSGLFAQQYTEDRFVSGYANAVYSFKNKYSLTGSARVDQSNLFGSDPKNRYKPSWSIGAGWNIDKEKFVNSLEWLNAIKMRAALGFNGNIAKNALPQVIASSVLNTFDNTFNSLQLYSPANSRLRWERTYNLNIGIDYKIFKNITGNIDYYMKKSMDILASNQVDPTRGVTSAIINQSSIRNTGLEIGLHADWINRPGFNWNTGFVLSYNRSKILKVYNVNVPPNSKSFTYALNNRTNYLEGYAVGSVFTYRYAGVDDKGATLIYDKEGKTKNFDVDDQGIDDVDYAGTTIPPYNLGLSNRVDIGNFYVFVMANYFGGFRVRLPLPLASAMRPYEGANNFWRKPGDENIPDVMPALKYSSYNSYLAASDRFVKNGTYITVSDITVAYSFRRTRFLKKMGLSDFEIRAQASNVYTVAMNKENYSVATGSYEKTYLTPTYTMAVHINF
ncbi:SusC/RagA family TonB-linked outer membrane protein [Filimonas effusa]|uniref:SusC/RagA family TonB-linked outer membrane protein n=1 Tax=Filimonas effusa TaxID=2508721 RepID=A0A4Q1D5F5_9BACT|nr:SusC/RagA family TonB-linked outer membrane protein [Filimonas effusa]RXK83608.1 SusC/RagA family TonB-linked outer membrane protein [Filimonas effusa]